MITKSKLAIRSLLLIIIIVMVGCNIPPWPTWPTKVYSITFDKNNEQATGKMRPQIVTEGDKIVLPANNFSLDGYNFIGWSTSPSGSVLYEDEGVYSVGYSDTILYAQWEITSSFRTSWQVTGTSLRFPLFNGGNYDFTIWWGDDTSEKITNVSGYFIEHTYSDPGIYEVEIQGICKGFGYQPDYAGEPNTGYLIDVLEWGDVSLHDLGSQFRSCTNLISFSAKDKPDTSNLTNMSNMFEDSEIFNGDLSEWNVSNVTNMSNMFALTPYFNQDISSWDVKNVTNMKGMFNGALAFNQNISAWDVSSVTNMEGMFWNAMDFNQNISSWDVSSVGNMGHMFRSASAFNQNISTWDVRNVTNMEGMFSTYTSFNQDISSWDVSNVTNMIEMFSYATAFNQNISAWGSKVSESISHSNFSSGCPLITEYHPYESWDN